MSALPTADEGHIHSGHERLVAFAEEHGRPITGDMVTNAEDGRRSAPWPHSSADPTGTKTIRDRYSGEMYRRFRALKGALVEGIVDNDAFGLSRNPRANAASARGLAAQSEQGARALGFTSQAEARASFEALADPGINIEPPDPGMFAFPSDDRKVREFNDYLDRQVNRGILERSLHDGRESIADRSWQNVYIRSSYEKGVKHADAAMVNEDIIPPNQMLDDVFRATRHVDGAGMLYTRAFEELDGVTESMAQSMTRELTDGFTQGENPRKIARRLNDRVDKVGLHRGRLIARTETIRAHNEAALNRYEDMGARIDGVRVLAEFVTAGDNRVCPECEALEATEFTISDVRGLIPVHPNCRCTYLPIQSDRAGPTESPT